MWILSSLSIASWAEKISFLATPARLAGCSSQVQFIRFRMTWCNKNVHYNSGETLFRKNSSLWFFLIFFLCKRQLNILHMSYFHIFHFISHLDVAQIVTRGWLAPSTWGCFALLLARKSARQTMNIIGN